MMQDKEVSPSNGKSATMGALQLAITIVRLNEVVTGCKG